jgi:hypothetical protein
MGTGQFLDVRKFLRSAAGISALTGQEPGRCLTWPVFSEPRRARAAGLHRQAPIGRVPAVADVSQHGQERAILAADIQILGDEGDTRPEIGGRIGASRKTAMTLLRAPVGLPPGLPDCPALKVVDDLAMSRDSTLSAASFQIVTGNRRGAEHPPEPEANHDYRDGATDRDRQHTPNDCRRQITRGIEHERRDDPKDQPQQSRENREPDQEAPEHALTSSFAALARAAHFARLRHGPGFARTASEIPCTAGSACLGWG